MYESTCVELYEDNAGHLFLIVTGDLEPHGWSEIEQVTDSTFAEDASAIIHGQTYDWTVPEMSREQIQDVLLHATNVATYLDQVTVHRHASSGLPLAGIAARRYLGDDFAE